MTSGVRPPVLCAACGSRFDAEGATTGDRVSCPMCGVVVEVAGMTVERRRVKKSPPAPPREPHRLSPGDLKRIYVRLFLVFLGGLLVVGVWLSRDVLSSAWRDATDRRAKSR
jgi:DNA-directed RNA polymerase subunit RPC12/RpoP